MLIFFEILALVFVHILSLLAAFHAWLTKHDPRSALGWTVALVFLPVIGLITYLIFGISRSQSRAERIMRHEASIARHYAGIIEGEEKLPASWGDRAVTLSAIGYTVARQFLAPGNSVTPLHNGNEAYPAMLEAIDEAREHVFLTSYIFSYGDVAKKFIAALERAHDRGVDVRVIVDGIGALYSWRKPWRILQKSGIPTALFRAPRLFPPNFGINLRSHRKVLVCDRVGFTGGMNIADGDFIAEGKNLRKEIQDMQFRCVGPVVTQLRKAFLLNWSFCIGEITPMPPLKDEPAGNCHCRVIIDGPGNDADAINDLICGVIALSRRTVRIMTPYFLPTHGLMGALRCAAQRGVDVRIILPGMNNLPYMTWATRRLLPELMSAGVRVWYQPPPFAHTKLLAVDGIYSQVGSANLDARSLRLNFELNMEVFDRDFHDNLATFMDQTIEKSRELTLGELKYQPLPYKLRDAACWIFSPYL